MNRVRLLVTFLLCVAFSHVSAQNVVSHKYKLVWKDDFKGKSVDSSSWSRLYRTDPGTWGMYMSDCDSLYELRKGVLRLYGKVNTFEHADTATYLCGGVTTRHKRSVRYGKVEVRMKMVGAKGSWPAVWLMPTNYKDWEYPKRAEIDILEYTHRNTFVYQTVHTYYTDVLGEKTKPVRQVKSPIRYEDYNVYSVEILPEELIFRINGDVTFRYPNLYCDVEGQYPFGVDSYLMIDMQIGGTGVGDASVVRSTFPAYIDVDWVKFYEMRK